MAEEQFLKKNQRQYEQGFVSDVEAVDFPKGLNEDIVRRISKIKEEPEFVLEYRLKAFRYWQTLEEPEWAHLKIDPIDYQDLRYYAAPKSKTMVRRVLKISMRKF